MVSRRSTRWWSGATGRARGPIARPGGRGGGDRGRVASGRTQHPQGQDAHLRRGVQPLLADCRQQRPRSKLPLCPGDELVFHDQLFSKGKQVGDEVGSCVIASITPELLANCTLVIRLPGGNITGQFVAISGPTPKQLALTGGISTYSNVGGEGPWSSSATAREADAPGAELRPSRQGSLTQRQGSAAGLWQWLAPFARRRGRAWSCTRGVQSRGPRRPVWTHPRQHTSAYRRRALAGAPCQPSPQLLWDRAQRRLYAGGLSCLPGVQLQPAV
jgi:hypothetical protein